jgi:hypothetical protein
MPVVTNRDIVCYHAYLPKYREQWHSEPMGQWTSFDFAGHGFRVRPGTRNGR